MVFYGIVIVAVIGFIVWFVRTPSFRHLRSGHSKDPGQRGAHASGSMIDSNRDFRKND